MIAYAFRVVLLRVLQTCNTRTSPHVSVTILQNPRCPVVSSGVYGLGVWLPPHRTIIYVEKNWGKYS